MQILSRMREWWWARQRATDLSILWPICRDRAPDRDTALAAFMVHAAQDPCWIQKYGDNLWKEVERQCQ
jgi:hypothetical protein